jgi:hypothetical protein
MINDYYRFADFFFLRIKRHFSFPTIESLPLTINTGRSSVFSALKSRRDYFREYRTDAVRDRVLFIFSTRDNFIIILFRATRAVVGVSFRAKVSERVTVMLLLRREQVITILSDSWILIAYLFLYT